MFFDRDEILKMDYEAREKKINKEAKMLTLGTFILCMILAKISTSLVLKYEERQAELRKPYAELFIDITKGEEVVISSDIDYHEMIDKLKKDKLLTEDQADKARAAVLIAKLPEMESEEEE